MWPEGRTQMRDGLMGDSAGDTGWVGSRRALNSRDNEALIKCSGRRAMCLICVLEDSSDGGEEERF